MTPTWRPCSLTRTAQWSRLLSCLLCFSRLLFCLFQPPGFALMFACPCSAQARDLHLQILKLPALERDGARNPNPLPFNDKI